MLLARPNRHLEVLAKRSRCVVKSHPNRLNSPTIRRDLTGTTTVSRCQSPTYSGALRLLRRAVSDRLACAILIENAIQL